MQIGIQVTFLAMFLLGTTTLLIYHQFKLRQARWPIWFSLIVTLMVLLIRTFKSVYYYMESAPSANFEAG